MMYDGDDNGYDGHDGDDDGDETMTMTSTMLITMMVGTWVMLKILRNFLHLRSKKVHENHGTVTRLIQPVT